MFWQLVVKVDGSLDINVNLIPLALWKADCERRSPNLLGNGGGYTTDD